MSVFKKILTLSWGHDTMKKRGHYEKILKAGFFPFYRNPDQKPNLPRIIETKKPAVVWSYSDSDSALSLGLG